MKLKTDAITPTEVQNIARTPKDESRALLKKFMDEETKMVKGIFRCYETPGAREKISVKKYPTKADMLRRNQEGGVEPFEMWMSDGQTYEVPLYVARFLNGTDKTAASVNGKINTCAYPVHGFTWDNGNQSGPQSQIGMDGTPVPVLGPSQWKRRYGFESLEFNAE
jgi:hypothetical protein